MPPIGFVLSDEQIASVLTYIRREWGQTGAPVDPAVVAKVRAVTGDRLRAWTDAELMKIISEQK
jgi:mono/diheme cytochrome c family protein